MGIQEVQLMLFCYQILNQGHFAHPTPPHSQGYNISGCHNRSGGATGIQWADIKDGLNILKCIGQLHNNYPTPNANSAEVEKPCTIVADMSV